MEKISCWIHKIIQIIKEELKDPFTFLLFFIVMVVMYSPAWGGYLLYFMSKQVWFAALASAYVAFWAGPFTPFFPLCIALTLWIRRVLFKITEREKENEERKSNHNM